MSVRRVFTATLAVVALFFTGRTMAAGQSAQLVASPMTQGVVSGEVIDASGAVLPGVTVTATAADGRLLATTVTDDSGSYAFSALPAEPIALAFELEGFAGTTVKLAVQAGSESQVVQRLDVAPFAETVVVRGEAPPERPVRPLPPPRRPPVVGPVVLPERDAICGPAKPGDFSEFLGTIESAREESAPGLYANGAELVIDGGLDNGLEVGRNLIVRRRYRVEGDASADAIREHSAGLLQIVEADDRSSIAVVIYACDELRKGDFLAAFTPPPVQEQDTFGAPDYHEAVRILFADEGQLLGAPRRLMVIGRGSDRGTFVGQRFTLFRQRPGPEKRQVVGNAVVVAVRPDSATIRVDRVTDAIAAGDWAAPQVPSPVARSFSQP